MPCEYGSLSCTAIHNGIPHGYHLCVKCGRAIYYSDVCGSLVSKYSKCDNGKGQADQCYPACGKSPRIYNAPDDFLTYVIEVKTGVIKHEE